MKTSFLLILTLFATAPAQWSTDPTLNLMISDESGEQVLPKIAATSDGGCFISWFDQRSGSYRMYIQRLDCQGNPLFQQNGIEVSSAPQQSWLVDYCLGVDGDDNAVLAFSDLRSSSGNLEVSAYRISSQGEFLWGTDGIILSDPSNSGFNASPVVAVTLQGNSVFSWSVQDTDQHVTFQKLDPDGNRLWGQWGIEYAEPGADLSSPLLVPSGEDSVIVLWKRSTGSYPMTITHLYADRLDANGNFTLPGGPLLVYDGGAITPWNNPEMVSDGNGGALCTWYDAPSLSQFNVWAQHLDAEGNPMYPFGGAQASTYSSDRLHMSPSGAFSHSTGCSFVFWVETSGNQDMWGLCGQKFDGEGNRQWSDSGLELLPLGNEQISFPTVSVDNSGIYVCYLSDSGGTALRAFRLGLDGTLIWGPVTLSAASLGGKDDPVFCTGYAGSLYCSWTDCRNDYGIYAQNVNADGSLGPFMGITEPSPEEMSLSINGNPCRETVFFTLKGPVGPVTLQVFDLTGRLAGTVTEDHLLQGETTLQWTPESHSSGMYMVRLSSSGEEVVRKLVMVP